MAVHLDDRLTTTVRRLRGGWEATCSCGWWAFGPNGGASRLDPAAPGRAAAPIDVENFVRVNLESHLHAVHGQGARV